MQSGFRHGDSTSLHLANLVQRLCTLQDRRHYLGLCFFDLAKAFDSVWHRGLLAKLHAYGVTGRLQSWLTSYLNNRTQSVKLGPVLSDSIPICSGVPRGSTLLRTVTLPGLRQRPPCPQPWRVSVCRRHLYAAQ